MHAAAAFGARCCHQTNSSAPQQTSLPPPYLMTINWSPHWQPPSRLKPRIWVVVNSECQRGGNIVILRVRHLMTMNWSPRW